jgi:hypothetical protein
LKKHTYGKEINFKNYFLFFSLTSKAISIKKSNITATTSVVNGTVILFINSSTVCNANQVNVQSITIRVINNLYLPEINWDDNLIKAIENKSTTVPKRKKNNTKPIREYGDVYCTPNNLKKPTMPKKKLPITKVTDRTTRSVNDVITIIFSNKSKSRNGFLLLFRFIA